MTLVLVHGNPETSAIWDDLIPLLPTDDIVILSPPGFGAPLPEGFDATMSGYLKWLIEQVSQLKPPIDLIGHDWGGGHVVRLACERPDLIRSWTSDILGIFTPEYIWHERAQIWQTPGEGEKAVAEMISAPLSEKIEFYKERGMSDSISGQVSEWVNEDMAKSNLTLYRSAAQPVVGNLFDSLKKASAKPGLAIIATADPAVGGEVLGRKAAEQTGAQIGILEGVAHWWMCTHPNEGAQLLNSFLSQFE